MIHKFIAGLGTLVAGGAMFAIVAYAVVILVFIA